MRPPSPPESANAADGPDWTGRIVAGRYRVEAVLGVGGMGAAYRAHDLRTDRLVVVKVPHSKHFGEEESRARFQDEVRKLLQIEHLHVLKVFDVGEEDGEPFAVFQHLAGGSLETRIRAAGGRLAPDEVVPWLTQVADALDHLHARGDIHRDVKPDNILFDGPTATGRSNAFLADFGLAKALGVDPTRVFQSRTGTLVGTQAFMAPEQFNREAPVTGAIDQYALATTVYQALSHELPFAVSSAEELVFEKVTKSPRPLRDVAAHVPAGVAAAVMRALATKPGERYPSCGEFARAFAWGLAGDETRPAPAAPLPASRAAAPESREPVSVGGVGRRADGAPVAGRRSRLRWVAAVAVIVGGLGGLGLLFGGRRGGASLAAGHGEAAGSPARTPPASTSPPLPAWAKVAPDQLAEANRLAVPVAFEDGIGLRFVLVPAGTFTMGSPEHEKGRDAGETQHRVTLTRSYYMSIHETTNRQYRRFEEGHDSGDRSGEPLNADTQPVVKVSHTDAVRFAAWLSGQEGGRTYRLPTESEWEYAARAKTTTSRYWGDDEAGFPRNANIADAKAKATFGFAWSSAWDDGFATTAPVGSFSPNGWGLYDMIGNVWEWCADWEADYPTGSATDPTGPASGSSRVLRGGSWYYLLDFARAASRGSDVPDARYGNGGFRLVVPAGDSR